MQPQQPSSSRRRMVVAAVAALAVVGTASALPAANAAPSPAPNAATAPAAKPDKPHKPSKPKPNPNRLLDIQLLSFNDFHGHLEANDSPASPLPPTTPPVGGVEHLSSAVKTLTAQQGAKTSLTVAAGDLIGGSTFLSGMFQDEPAIQSLNELGLDVSSVGNHEFDEGTDELQRIVEGGCHPTKGCFEDLEGNPIPYTGTDFEYLAANVVNKSDGSTFLPGTTVKKIKGVRVGFIGMTLEATDALVNPAGVSSVDFLDEVEAGNRAAAELKARGVETIVVLMHEGGYQSGTYNQCSGISGPVVDIASKLDPEIDQIVTGHTHQPYICNIPDPDGQPRLVTSAASYGQVLTESHLMVDRATKDVVRDVSTATNRLVLRSQYPADPAQTKIIEFWKAIQAPIAAQVVGTLAPPDTNITGDSSTCRCEETPMADLVADAILWGTQAPEDGGAQMAFMNTGGVRASLLYDQITNGEQPGEITLAEAYAVAPFNNIVVTQDMTGQDIYNVLNQQLQRIPARGSRPMLSLGVSEGLTYEWQWVGGTPPPNTQPAAGITGSVVPGSVELNGVPIVLGQTYRVATLNFLADGGDSFSAFTAGTNRLGGPEDLPNLTAYLTAHPNITAPEDRVTGL